MSSSKLKFVLAVILGGILSLPGSAQPEVKEAVRTDANGDPLPPGAKLRLGTGRFRQAGWNFAFFPDGKRIVSLTEHSLRFWETATGKLLGEYDTPDASFQGFALSADGKRIALAGSLKDNDTLPAPGVIRIWDTATHKEIRTMKCGERETPSRVLFTPDGKYLLSNGGAGLRVWDVEAGTDLFRERLDGREVRTLALSPDGKLVAAGDQAEGFYLWKWDSGKEPRKIKLGDRGVSSLAFNSDGTHLAVGGDYEDGVRLWDVAGGQWLRRLNRHDALSSVYGLACSPDGKLLATNDGGNRAGSNWSGGVHLWDIATGKQVRTLVTPGEGISKVAFSRDGRWLAGSGENLHVWDMRSGKEVLAGVPGHRGRINQVAASASGLIASASDDHTVRLWDSTTGKHLQTLQHRHWVRGLALSPDGKRLVSASLDDTMSLWDTATGKRIFELPGHGRWGGYRPVAFTADGKRILSFGDDFYLRTTSVSTGKAVQEYRIRPKGILVPEEGEDLDPVRAMLGRPGDGRFSPDGKTFVLNVRNGFRIYDAPTNKELREVPGEGSSVASMAVSPDGKYLLASAWGKQVVTKLPDGRQRYSAAKNHPICVWEIATGKLLHMVNLPEGGAGPVAFSADGKYFAAGEGKPKPRITIWETASGKPVRTFEKIGGTPTALAFSADGKRVISAMEDSTVLLWDLDR